MAFSEYTNFRLSKMHVKTAMSTMYKTKKSHYIDTFGMKIKFKNYQLLAKYKF